GKELAGKWRREGLAADERRGLIPSIASYYRHMQSETGALGVPCRLLSAMPSAAERVNRLARVPRRISPTVKLLLIAGSIYAKLLGGGAGKRVSALDVSRMGLTAGLGAGAGALACAAVLLPIVPDGSRHVAFLVAGAAVGLLTGGIVGGRLGRRGASAGRLGWSISSASVFFVCANALGFCLAGWQRLSVFALQLPVAFALALLFAAVASVLVVRVVSGRRKRAEGVAAAEPSAAEGESGEQAKAGAEPADNGEADQAAAE
ncbi:unnamed protein product, partial [marine sediment metagenome]